MSEERMRELWNQMQDIRRQMLALGREMGAMDVPDYILNDPDGNPVKLSELFGDKNDLILVHNMGRHCWDCTMWADGFNGLRHHLNSRASFVVCTPDEP